MPFRSCMCLSQFFPVAGGAERQAHILAKYLIQKGHQVFVLTQRKTGHQPKEVLEGVPVERVIRTIDKGPLFGISFLLSLISLLIRKRRRYDIIHLHQAYLSAFAAGLLSGLLKKKVVVKVACGGEYGDMRRLEGTKLSWLFFAGIKRADRFVAISDQIREELLSYGFAQEKIVRIPNGVDLTRFHPGTSRIKDLFAGRSIVLFVGRLDEQKGVEFLLRAWRRVKEEDKRGPVLLLLGQGQKARELNALTSSLDLGESVRFLGRVENVEDYLRAAEVFVLPSLAEGMPNVLLEAMATGVAIVASSIGGITDLVQDGESAELVPPRDEEKLAAAISKLLHDKASSKRLGKAALERARRDYSIEAVGRKYEDLYGQLLA